MRGEVYISVNCPITTFLKKKQHSAVDNFETTLGYHGDGDYLVTIGGALWAAFGQLFDKCGERLRLFLGGVVR